MEAKHTPGPWSCDYGDSAVFCDTGAEIACITHGNHGEGSAIACDEAICNLKLIAAAPELLDALRYMVENAEAAGWSGLMLDDARTAIAKAEGRE